MRCIYQKTEAQSKMPDNGTFSLYLQKGETFDAKCGSEMSLEGNGQVVSHVNAKLKKNKNKMLYLWVKVSK